MVRERNVLEEREMVWTKRERERESAARGTEKRVERKVAMPTAAAVQGLRFLSSHSLPLALSLTRPCLFPIFILFSALSLSLPSPFTTSLLIQRISHLHLSYLIVIFLHSIFYIYIYSRCNVILLFVAVSQITIIPLFTRLIKNRHVAKFLKTKRKCFFSLKFLLR